MKGPDDTKNGRLRVEVDMNLCQSNGLCCIAAPEVFELGDDDVLRYEPAPDPSQREAVEEAVRSCPVQAITAHED
jgi:ferredoxin